MDEFGYGGSMRTHIYRRWWGPLGAATLMALLLALGLKAYYSGQGVGNTAHIGSAMKYPILARFAQGWFLQEILPLYAVTAYLLWLPAAVLGSRLLGPDWREVWRGRTAFLGVLGGLLLLHAWLWWKVPGAMAVIPGLSHLPFWMGLPLPLLAGLALLRVCFPAGRRGWVLVLTTGLWAVLLAEAPLRLRELQTARKPVGAGPVDMVLLAQDGLRLDTAYEAGLDQFQGQHAQAGYTPVCGTRMLYSILWGGDPLRFTTSHIIPDIEEFDRQAPFHVVEELASKGRAIRFFIDDGGTVGLIGPRRVGFDRIQMPANGWENFINSNLSVHFPIFASWLDVLRIFPTTNPWASMDLGLRRTLDEGRGGKVVMFHSCLAHQPIFLTRDELRQLPRWWTLSPRKLEPLSALDDLGRGREDTDPRRNPTTAYRLRMTSVLQAWAPIWNKLAEDPDYKNATRIFFSDHGERFLHLTEQLQIAGVHGYDIDPWQMQVPFVLAGPGAEPDQARKHHISLLGLRQALHDYAGSGARPTMDGLAKAPILARWNLARTPMEEVDSEFYNEDPKAIQEMSYIGPGGLWLMRYKVPVSERGLHAAVARMEAGFFTVYRPLKKGGALKTRYRGYQWLEDTPVDEATYRKVKGEVEVALVDQAIR